LGDGSVLLRKRPERGLLGGMMEVPSSPWLEEGVEPLAHAPFAAAWSLLPGSVTHVFTHFRLELRVLRAPAPAAFSDDRGLWVDRQALATVALPTLMRKVVALAAAAR
jgi:A/G-specific adenine glycosylase